MRIALVVHDFARALGHGRYTVELARHFRHRHEVHVFSNTVDEADTEGIRLHRVPAVRVNALATVLSFPLPATLAVGRGWDIVHAQGACCFRFNVITAHICQAAWARAQRTAVVARTWRQRVFERTLVPLERAMFSRWPDAEVIAISHQLRGELRTFYGRADRVEVIHHGVDTDLFSPANRGAHRQRLRAELGLGDRDVAALFVGDLRKGAAVVLEVLARTADARIVFVSRSDPRPFVERARALGVEGRAIFRPATTAIERYYAATDVFLFPSPYDAFGMVVSEALASGMPVIVSRQAGASELIEDGASGFVIADPLDPAPIAERLQRLASDDRLRCAMGNAGRRVAERYRWADVAERTMRVYERATPLP